MFLSARAQPKPSCPKTGDVFCKWWGTWKILSMYSNSYAEQQTTDKMLFYFRFSCRQNIATDRAHHFIFKMAANKGSHVLRRTVYCLWAMQTLQILSVDGWDLLLERTDPLTKSLISHNFSHGVNEWGERDSFHFSFITTTKKQLTLPRVWAIFSHEFIALWMSLYSLIDVSYSFCFYTSQGETLQNLTLFCPQDDSDSPLYLLGVAL